MLSTEVGYIGGHVPNVTYKQVCGGDTGHAEAVRVTYDPSRVDYEALVDIFWENHDPTQANGQGVNIGDQYRSAIFYHDAQQREIAERSKTALDASGRFRKPIATQVVEASGYVPAEDYHQQYYEKKGLTTSPLAEG